MTHSLGDFQYLKLEGREKANSNFEQLPFKVRNRADLIVIIDSGKLNTGSYGISGINRSEGRTGIIWKKEVLWEGVAFDIIGNIYNKKEYIPFAVSTHVECVVVIYRDRKH
jgi:hypothetical protein